MKAVFLVAAAVGFLTANVSYAESGADLAKAKGCLNCHAVDKKKVGPAFKDVAAKYKGNKDAEAKLAGALKEGKGHPTKASASDAELKSMVQFVLSQK